MHLQRAILCCKDLKTFDIAAGDEFDDFMHEVMDSLRAWQAHLLVQFEDFANNNAFRLLEAWRHKMCAFNDDIQASSASLHLVLLPLPLGALLVAGQDA